MDNRQQIDEWNGALGHSWAQWQDEIENITVPLGRASMEAARARTGERVLDIGCGCGTTSIELARSVGPAGHVTGVDVSRPMLEVARRRAAAQAVSQVSFVEADASSAALPAELDLLYSRFGVMFFADPVAAFRHLRAALKPGARTVFLCWRSPRDNPWAMAPLAAARAALGITAAPMDPDAPGPFAFADEARVRRILDDAGFVDVALERRDALLQLGVSAAAAAERSLRLGPSARLAREVGAAHAPAIVRAIESALAPHAAADGAVRLSGSGWIVSARNPS